MPTKNGLSQKQAENLLEKYGKNEIKRTKKEPPWKIFLAQFTSPLILILIAAAIVSFFVGHGGEAGNIDTALILIIVFASGIAGFFQEYKAERAIEALRNMAKPQSIVIRDGVKKEIPASEIAPGDIVVLEGGDIVPADGKIIEGMIEADESILTGESRDIKKDVGDELFSGSAVACGRALMQTTKTGMDTRIGKLAQKMQEIEESLTPFQVEMKDLGRKICYSIAGIILLMVAARYILFGASDLTTSLLIALSLAVAAIPEGLPAVLTIGLSRGANSMAKNNALVRKLSVVESIGAVDTICTDKTGTLTEGRLKVREFFLGAFGNSKSEEVLRKCAILCNDAKTVSKNGEQVLVGDENDVALKEFFGGNPAQNYERADEIPFNSARKMQIVVCAGEGITEIFSKGAPEVLLQKCSKILEGKKAVALTEKMRQKIIQKNDGFALSGRRVLGFAYKPGNSKPYDSGLIWIGLVSFSDPPRPEVKGAIEDCRNSGIRTIMITGDNPKTALAIAKEVGLFSKVAVTGEELDSMDDKSLEDALRDINVFARTSPMHKLRILEALQKQGHIVAMTGDGVNDSLAIKRADIGIAMGIKGTEVTKEVSDIILLDDNFATIRSAIREGRTIFDNIRKFLRYMFTCNLAEVIVVFLGTLFFRNPLLLPAQILWINLVTDGLPSIALASDPPRDDIMRRPPRKKESGVLDRQTMMSLVKGGLLMSAALLAVFLIVNRTSGWEAATTSLFMAFVFYEIIRIISVKKVDKIKTIGGWLKNKLLIGAIVASVLLQVALLAFPATRELFRLTPIGIFEWSIIFGVMAAYYAAGVFFDRK
jgi:Ca2+-transporting ATPase